MASPTDQELLDSYRTALKKIGDTGGVVTYTTPDGRQVTRDAKWLSAEVERLEGKLASESGGFATILARPERRR